MHTPYQFDTPAGQALLLALREACAPLPEVTEVVDGFGHTTFKVARKSFVIAGMSDAAGVISIKSDPVNQAHLVRTGPYYRSPYIGQHGWVSVTDPLAHDWDEIRELIADAYRMVAPKRLRQRLEQA